MDISVIIVSWNAKNYLKECIESLESEVSNYDSEIIVVDNASDDGSPELVIEYFPQVKLIRNESNLGFAKANNIGIKYSSGKYLFLINSDIKVIKDCIKILIEYGEQNLHAGIIGPKILTPEGKVQRSCMGFPTLWNSFCRTLALDSLFPKSKVFGGQLLNYWNHDSNRNVDVINGCFWMVRREALNQVGLLDEDFFIYGEDIDWCKRFKTLGWEVVFFPEAKAIHYGGASSANSPTRFFIEMQRANIKYWDKHHNYYAKKVYVFLLLVHHVVRILGNGIKFIFLRKKKNDLYNKIQRNWAAIKWIINGALIMEFPILL